MTGDKNDKMVFWGCFIALVTTAFAFVGRLFLINVWAGEFSLDPAQAGRLAGIGIWPFAVSIIGFSLVIDRIGYKTAMLFAAAGPKSPIRAIPSASAPIPPIQRNADLLMDRRYSVRQATWAEHRTPQPSVPTVAN